MKNLIMLLIILIAPVALTPLPAYSETESVVTDTRATIDTILELTVSQEGQSELRFGNIQPSAIDATEAGPIGMLIEVNSNSGEPYQVTQTISSPLENSEGDKIDLDHLRFVTSSSKSNGGVVSSPTPVSASSQVIFTSDAQGTSDTISAQYMLSVPPSQAPGDYSTLLTYTVSSS